MKEKISRTKGREVKFNEENYTNPKFPKISFEVEITNYIKTQESLIAQVNKLKELFVRLNNFNEALEANSITDSSKEMKKIYEIAIQDETHYRQAFDFYSTIYGTDR